MSAIKSWTTEDTSSDPGEVFLKIPLYFYGHLPRWRNLTDSAILSSAVAYQQPVELEASGSFRRRQHVGRYISTTQPEWHICSDYRNPVVCLFATFVLFSTQPGN